MKSYKLLLLGASLSVLSLLASAQTRDVGTFVGTVYDDTGLAIPGVTLTALNVQTGMKQETITNTNGHYRLERLPRGFYTITASLEGFKTFVKEGLELWAGAELRIDFILELGRIEEEVTVVSESPIVETTRSQVSTVFVEEEILAYPQGNRNYLTLISYAPGTMPAENEGSGFAINGMRANSNNFMIDGIDNNHLSWNSDEITTLPLESIQEFRLVSNNFSAEYGRNSGGIINVVMKSGTNEVHGSAWVFYRGDSALFRTEDWLTRDRPIFSRWQYGGTIGGPIWKDRTFFFLSFEGINQREEARDPQWAYTQESVSRARGFSREIFDYFKDSYPYATYDFVDLDGDGVNDYGRTVWNGETKTNFYNFGIKIDHIFSSKDRMTLRWLHNHGESNFHDFFLPGYTKEIPDRFNTGGITWLHIFSPNMYNELRVGYHSDQDVWEKSIPNFPSIGNWQFYVFDDSVGNDFKSETFQLSEVLSFQAGNHSIKLGGELRYWRTDTFIDAILDGFYDYVSPLDFIYDSSPAYLYIGTDPPDPDPSNPYVPGNLWGEWKRAGLNRKFRGIEGGLFVQDDWRISDRLTLSFGLRWEYFGVPEEYSGRGISTPAFGTEQGYNNTVAGNLDITEGEYNREGIRYLIFDGRELQGKGIWDPYYKAFAPKFSFAYDLTGDGKTSLRGGVGVAYDRLTNYLYENERFNYPEFTFAAFLGPPYGFPSITPTMPASIPMANVYSALVSLRWMLPNLPPQKAYNWLFGIQRELASNASIEINYTGSLGRNLGIIQRPNRFTGDGLDGVVDGINPYASVPDVNTREHIFESTYHAVTVVLNKRFSNGWSWYTAYTFGKTRDQNSGYGGTGSGANFYAASHGRYEDEWGPSAFNSTHRIVGGIVWQIPFFRDSENWFVRDVIAGWQLSSNFYYASGRPLNVSSDLGYGIYDFNQDWNGNDRPLWIGDDPKDVIKWEEGKPYLDRSLFAIPNPPEYADDMNYYEQNFATRNMFNWFPTYNINIALQKNFIIPVGAKDVNLQLIAEIFNLLKDTFWELPVTDLSRPDFGQVTRKNGVRELQLSIRVMF